jgi:hypothetical protein
MPQLDLTFFPNVILYLIIIFFTLVYFLHFYFLPYISLIIDAK